MAKRGLGRGLGALISSQPKAAKAPADSTDLTAGTTELEIALISPSPYQPRKSFDDEELASLAESIRQQGLIQAITVRRHGDRYQIIAGERRFRALQKLGWEKAPAVIREATDNQMREMALVENLQRSDLNPIEIASAYRELNAELGLTHEQIAEHLGGSRAKITNYMRLLELPEEIRQMLISGELSAGHGRAILSLPDPLSQITLARRVAAEGMSVRAVEKLVTGKKSPGKKSQTTTGTDPHIADLENRLRDHLGTRVSIRDKGGKGTITIEYYTHDDVTRIIEQMQIKDI